MRRGGWEVRMSLSGTALRDCCRDKPRRRLGFKVWGKAIKLVSQSGRGSQMWGQIARQKLSRQHDSTGKPNLDSTRENERTIFEKTCLINTKDHYFCFAKKQYRSSIPLSSFLRRFANDPYIYFIGCGPDDVFAIAI